MSTSCISGEFSLFYPPVPGLPGTSELADRFHPACQSNQLVVAASKVIVKKDSEATSILNQKDCMSAMSKELWEGGRITAISHLPDLMYENWSICSSPSFSVGSHTAG